MAKLKTIFFGTPEISVPYLDLVQQLSDVQLCVTQADKPRGRGMVITPCPVKQRALALGLPVRSPEKMKDIFEEVQHTPFDLGVAVAFGKIFRPDFLALPKLGIINVHFSLLPLLRGAAPVQHALFNDFKKTGVTVFWIRPGMDDGPVLLQQETAVDPQDNAETLFHKLIPLGLHALKEALEQISAGQITQTAQLGEPTWAPMIQKEDAVMDFQTMSAADIHNKVRGLACGPKARTFWQRQGKSELLQILRTQLPTAPQGENQAPGTVLAVESPRGILVKCKQGSIWLTEVHPAGKKPMSAAAFANGYALQPGQRVFVCHG
ncbi:methionyl-tRNA formyltransferase [Candidatus Avelusimicrobium facis]|uniref:methionyl-tRNA formyltransferase n=1 Tax=Candidatus Avelusimicrobium facis TaxID=3416203 RepID=UPI003D0A9548